MVGTSIILVRRPISLGLIKDLCNHAITVQRPLKWLKSRKERWSCQESNSGPLTYRAKCTATELQLPPATIPQSWPYVACFSLWYWNSVFLFHTCSEPHAPCSIIWFLLHDFRCTIHEMHICCCTQCLSSACITHSQLLMTKAINYINIPYGRKFWQEDILADCWNYDIWQNLLWRLRKS